MLFVVRFLLICLFCNTVLCKDKELRIFAANSACAQACLFNLKFECVDKKLFPEHSPSPNSEKVNLRKLKVRINRSYGAFRI